MMDIKGLGWVGNIYDKFEAMCLEIEEVMYEDTVKYVENQVQTVGASVKRFYSEVIQDLHKDSHIDPVKVAAADLSLNPYAHSKVKLKENAKKDGRDTNWDMNDDSEVISGKSKTGAYRRPIAGRKSNSMANFMPPVSGPVAPFSENFRNQPSFSQMKRSCDTASGRVDVLRRPSGPEQGAKLANENICKPIVDTGLPMPHAPVKAPTSATKTIVPEQKQVDSVSIPSSDGLSSESSGMCANSGVVSQSEKPIAIETDSMRPLQEEFFVAHQERQDDCSMDAAAENEDTLDSEVEIIELLNESVLEETCVLVEEDELHFVPQGKGGRKSYKKKLRDAFSSKTRLKRKEYEQLAARYTEQSSNQESAEKVMADPTADSNINSDALSTHGSEADWELL